MMVSLSCAKQKRRWKKDPLPARLGARLDDSGAPVCCRSSGRNSGKVSLLSARRNPAVGKALVHRDGRLQARSRARSRRRYGSQPLAMLEQAALAQLLDTGVQGVGGDAAHTVVTGSSRKVWGRPVTARPQQHRAKRISGISSFANSRLMAAFSLRSSWIASPACAMMLSSWSALGAFNYAMSNGYSG